MANEVKILTLTDAIAAAGDAVAFIGSLFTANSMAPIGHVAGDVALDNPATFNDLTVPELTGPAVHQRTVDGESMEATVPVVLTADGLHWVNTSPTGSVGGGFSSPQVAPTTSVAIIPRTEVGGGLLYNGTAWSRLAGNGVDAATGSDAAPKNALWFPRAHISRAGINFTRANGGRVVTPVRITAMWATQAGIPDGQLLYRFGDPGTGTDPWTTFFFGSPT